MADRTLEDVVKDLRKIAGNDTNLLIYLPAGEKKEPETKTNLYLDAYACNACGKPKQGFNSVCECGHWNYQWDITVSC